MTVAALRRLENAALSNNLVTELEARELIDAANDGGLVTAAEKAEIRAFLARSSMQMQPVARDLLTQFVSATPPPPPGSNEVI